MREQIYFTNTTRSHNKDYLITIDWTALRVDLEWGRIGASKARKSETFSSNAVLREFVNERMEHRVRHGYRMEHRITLASGVETVTVSHAPVLSADDFARVDDFASDVADMRWAEMN